MPAASATPATQTPTPIYVARQPILDLAGRVFGYELLFRSGTENAFNHDDPDQASRHTINNTLNLLGVRDLVGSKKMLINFPRELLLQRQYMVLPPEQTIIELLESVEPDADVIAACRELKKAGYAFALDDFVFTPAFEPLLNIADMMKVDFAISDRAERARLVRQYDRPDLAFLAEKVETYDELREAKDLGYTYFQGYFFARPAIVKGKDIPGHQHNYLRFLAAVSEAELDFDKIQELVKQESSLAVKLLRYLNSAALGVRQRITSIHHALALIGEQQLRKWAMLVSMTCLSGDKPRELLRVGLTRARFCEGLCQDLGMAGRELDLYLMGLLSTLDALTDRPMHELLQGLPLALDVRSALLGGSQSLGKVQLLVFALECGDWPNVSLLCGLMKIDEDRVAAAHLDAMCWADAVLAD